jgi:hypothetical protein
VTKIAVSARALTIEREKCFIICTPICDAVI